MELNRWSISRATDGEVQDNEDDREDQEHEQQHSPNPGTHSRDPARAQRPGDQGDNEEDDCEPRLIFDKLPLSRSHIFYLPIAE